MTPHPVSSCAHEKTVTPHRLTAGSAGPARATAPPQHPRQQHSERYKHHREHSRRRCACALGIALTMSGYPTRILRLYLGRWGLAARCCSSCVTVPCPPPLCALQASAMAAPGSGSGSRKLVDVGELPPGCVHLTAPLRQRRCVRPRPTPLRDVRPCCCQLVRC
jgi:hypothetical protein